MTCIRCHNRRLPGRAKVCEKCKRTPLLGSVSVSETAYATLKRIAETRGLTMRQVVEAWVEEVTP